MARLVLPGLAASPLTWESALCSSWAAPGSPLPGDPGADARAGASGGTAAGLQRDAAREAARLEEALEATAAELDALAAQLTARAGGEEVADILGAQALMARDPALLEAAAAPSLPGIRRRTAAPRLPPPTRRSYGRCPMPTCRPAPLTCWTSAVVSHRD